MLGMRSLKNRILFLFVGLAIIPFLLASLALQRQATTTLNRIGTATAESAASMVGAELDLQIERAVRLAVEYTPDLRNGTPSPAAQLSAHGIRSIRLLDGAGSERGAWVAPSDSTFAAQICGDGDEAPFVFQRSNLIPEHDDWRVEIALDPRWALLRHHTPELLGAEGVLAVTDGRSTALGDGECLAALRVAEAGFRVDGSPGKGIYPVSVDGWEVRARAQVETMAPTAMGLAGTINLIALAVAGLATFLFARSVSGATRPLTQLTAAADRIGAGDLTTWLPPPGQDEAGRLSLALSSMMTRIDQTMERMKRVGQMAAVGEVASYMTHEIRNPLSSLRLNLQAIERSAGRMNLIASSGRSLEICMKQVDRLEAVASGVLRLSRADTVGSLDLAWTHAVIRDAADLLKPEFDRRHVEVQLHLEAPDDTIRCDAQRLEAVFINLLLNAADAMPDGGRIWVRSHVASLEGRPAIGVRVSDSGPGIPKELRSRIFEPFFTTRDDGSGVGLSVAAQTIHDHGGTIEVGPRASVVEGAVFDITLPLAAEIEESVADPEAYGWPFAARQGSPPKRHRTREADEATKSSGKKAQ